MDLEDLTDLKEVIDLKDLKEMTDLKEAIDLKDLKETTDLIEMTDALEVEVIIETTEEITDNQFVMEILSMKRKLIIKLLLVLAGLVKKIKNQNQIYQLIQH